MSTPVLATKLFAPTRRAEFVVRQRLVEQLGAALDPNTRLTLLSAPAGFGKTTLVTDWLGHLARGSTALRMGWLTLDGGDNDLDRFLTHLMVALQDAGVGIDRNALQNLEGVSTAHALTALVNDVSRSEKGAQDTHQVLVLDDYHTVTAPEVHEAVAFLVDHFPDHLHLVVATRSDPPLPLPRLRSRGQLVEARAADLRFTPSEAQVFLNQVMALHLDIEAVHALEEKTEGWVAGLQLAALSLRGITEPDRIADFIEAFTGSNRFIIDYLADEVLARQPAEVRNFLLRTAVLDRFTGALCDAVTGGEEGARMLEDLERENLFLVPLDDQRLWYRYHHLFADVLHARLLAERPGQALELHRRASAWYADRHLRVDAVGHALAAKDFPRAAYLVEEAVPEMRRGRQDALLHSWIRALPESVVRRSPVLSIVTGWSLLVSGDLDAMALPLDDAEVALAAGEADPHLAQTWAQTEDLRLAPASISVYRAALAQARGDVAGTVHHARRALEFAGPGDHFILGAGGGLLGLATWADGRVSRALETFGAAVDSLHAAGSFVDELDSTVVLADMWVAQGRPSRARQLYERALTRATKAAQPYPRAVSDLHVGLAELDFELDDVVRAERHLKTARELARRASITENRYRWFVAMAHVRADARDYAAAEDLLDQAETVYRRGFYPEVRPISAIRARLQIAAGDLGAADAWADGCGVSVEDEAAYLREYEHLTLVRLILAHHRARGPVGTGGVDFSLTPVLGLLERLQAAAEEVGREGSVLEVRVLQALAHHVGGDTTDAVAVLRRAQSEAPEPESHVRLYLAEGVPIRELLHEVLSEPGRQAPEHLCGLLGRAGPLTSAGSTPQPPTARALSPREVEVLRLLDSELTGPEIARHLYVTVNTLRTHTKRIFTKLDVTSRAAAVRRARDLNLL